MADNTLLQLSGTLPGTVRHILVVLLGIHVQRVFMLREGRTKVDI